MISTTTGGVPTPDPLPNEGYSVQAWISRWVQDEIRGGAAPIECFAPEIWRIDLDRVGVPRRMPGQYENEFLIDDLRPGEFSIERFR